MWQKNSCCIRQFTFTMWVPALVTSPQGGRVIPFMLKPAAISHFIYFRALGRTTTSPTDSQHPGFVHYSLNNSTTANLLQMGISSTPRCSEMTPLFLPDNFLLQLLIPPGAEGASAHYGCAWRHFGIPHWWSMLDATNAALLVPCCTLEHKEIFPRPSKVPHRGRANKAEDTITAGRSHVQLASSGIVIERRWCQQSCVNHS